MIRTIVQSLRRHPGLNIAIVLTLALSLTAAVVVTGLIDTYLRQPLPQIDDRGVMIIEEFELSDGPGSRGRISWDTARDVRQQATSFSQVAIVTNASFTVHGDDATEVAYIPTVSPEFFPMLGVKAALGDIIHETNARQSGQMALMLSDELWRRRFGADPKIAGRAVQLDNQSTVVVGVLPPAFDLPSLGSGQQAWLAMLPEQVDRQDRRATRHFAFGQLAPGTRATTAAAEVQQLGNVLQAEYPETNGTRGVTATPLRDALLGPFQGQLWILMAMAVLVLLVACLNSGALLLAQALRRRREFAVRLALGARSGRLLRQFWIENLTLTIIAAVASLGLAAWISPAIIALLPGNTGVNTFADPDVNASSWLFALAAAAVAALLFGLMPWAIARHLPIDATLRSGGRSMGGGTASRWSRWLVTGQIAVALALATAAGLLVQSSRELNQVDYGLPVEELFQFRIGTRGSAYLDAESRLRFFENARESLARLPGVEAVSLAGFSYPNPPTTNQPFVQEGDGLELRDSPKEAHIDVVSPEFARTHDVRVLYGRFLEPTDRLDHPPVTVVTAELAERYWPGKNPVGKRVRLGGVSPDWCTIVGVVSDRRSIGHNPRTIDGFFVPVAQFTGQNTAAFVRFAGVEPPAWTSLQRAVWDLDPNVSLFFENRVSEFYANSAWQQRFSLVLIVAFAVLAVVLCSTGLYAMLAFAVAARTRELGVRAALGASAQNLRHQILRDATTMIVPGLGLGLLIAAGASRGLAGLLFNVPSFSPLIFTIVALLIGAVCLVAAWFPALRATKVDPAVALRSD
ncbi:ADOP family duplicated permease [Synoicihabitans lomoniglobus]|uniref:ADOP family duplicated permease n=1 Tax=Synoicihabitans lomoniglobus TaxID=2909285 RepID=A0AAF0CSL3_9BACT|nr:ADOP family duplicated permease [Opitutaceae bacterium LMO-M01]WED67264.1 ADOP family duplicated permease [Opitutaceae bacterium LMO-M01]